MLAKTEAGIRVPPNFTRLINLVPGMEEFLTTEGTKTSGYVSLEHAWPRKWTDMFI